MKTLAILSLVFMTVYCSKVRYDNFQLHRLTPNSPNQLKALQFLQDQNEGYSFWTDPVAIGGYVDILVPPYMRLQFEDFLKMQGIDTSVLMENVQEQIEDTEVTSRSGVWDWKDYKNLEEINEWLERQANEHPEVTLIKGGRSYEGRDILGVHVSYGNRNANRSVFLEGGIHAREWISPATVTYILNEILTSKDEKVRNMATSYDWYIFPNYNPDGYSYTFTSDRLWRKTRQGYGTCVGADPNRNWDYQWMGAGSSSNPCSETFAGGHAFSEPETKSMSEFINGIGDRLVAYIAVHSYSQLLLIPYGDRASGRCENYDELKEIGDKAMDSLAQRYGTQYTAGNLAEILYQATGSSMDWVKKKHGVRIVYTYELRDKGRYGFLLPKEQIIPTCEETLDSLVTMLS